MSNSKNHGETSSEESHAVPNHQKIISRILAISFCIGIFLETTVPTILSRQHGINVERDRAEADRRFVENLTRHRAEMRTANADNNSINPLIGSASFGDSE